MVAAGTGLKLFDFFFFFGGGGGILVSFNGVLSGNEMVIFFLFWHFSVRYNVKFIKIIRISMPHRLNVFFSHFFMKFYILAFKKKDA